MVRIKKIFYIISSSKYRRGPHGLSIQTLCVFLDLNHLTAMELRDAQTVMEEKVYRIWTVLSAFEGKGKKSAFDLLHKITLNI